MCVCVKARTMEKDEKAGGGGGREKLRPITDFPFPTYDIMPLHCTTRRAKLDFFFSPQLRFPKEGGEGLFRVVFPAKLSRITRLEKGEIEGGEKKSG